MEPSQPARAATRNLRGDAQLACAAARLTEHEHELDIRAGVEHDPAEDATVFEAYRVPAGVARLARISDPGHRAGDREHRASRDHVVAEKRIGLLFDAPEDAVRARQAFERDGRGWHRRTDEELRRR